MSPLGCRNSGCWLRIACSAARFAQAAPAPRSWRSWNPSQSKRAERSRLYEFRQAFLLLLIRHVEAASLVAEIQVIDGQYPHAETHFRADGIECGIERFFGDAEVRDAYGHDAIGAPDEQRVRREHGHDLESALLRQVVVVL